MTEVREAAIKEKLGIYIFDWMDYYFMQTSSLIKALLTNMQVY